MMNPLKKKILAEGIILKANSTGQTVDAILETYVKLTEEEKVEIKTEINSIK